MSKKYAVEDRTDSLTSEQKRKYTELIKEFRNIYSEELCMTKSENCSGGIVRSHTVSRSKYLAQIAEDKHVLQWTHSPWSPDKEGVISLKPIGLKIASTFNGFCNHHDTTLFAEIDNAPFQASPSQLFLQAYRAHAREVYCKRAQILAFPDAETIADLHGLENPKSYRPSDVAAVQMMAMDTGLRDTILHHQRLTSILDVGDFRRLRSCVVPLSGSPMIAVAGAFYPDFSATGEELQDFTDLESPLNTIHYSILPTESGGFAIFSFLDVESAGPEQFVLSVLESERLADLLVWIAYTYIENTQVRPSWWIELGEERQTSIKSAFACNINLHDPRLLTVSKYPGLHFTELSAGAPFWI
ncbi:hypothetical protein VSU19_00745 [Verrucomicrobiales bacterium BCK34]|nr:hypothetical protein [Verrucomicrobiales bacterium BCK34]